MNMSKMEKLIIEFHLVFGQIQAHSSLYIKHLNLLKIILIYSNMTKLLFNIAPKSSRDYIYCCC